ncbi:MAG: hypothetical protein U0746_15205 [Gemmataceae bacterium]
MHRRTTLHISPGCGLAMAMRIVVAAVVVAMVLGAAGALFGMLLGGMVGAVVSLCTDDRTGETRASWPRRRCPPRPHPLRRLRPGIDPGLARAH